MLTVPVPNLICLVAAASQAMLAEQTADGFQTHRVRVALEVTPAFSEFRHEPYAHETAFHAVRLDA